MVRRKNGSIGKEIHHELTAGEKKERSGVTLMHQVDSMRNEPKRVEQSGLPPSFPLQGFRLILFGTIVNFHDCDIDSKNLLLESGPGRTSRCYGRQSACPSSGLSDSHQLLLLPPSGARHRLQPFEGLPVQAHPVRGCLCANSPRRTAADYRLYCEFITLLLNRRNQQC